MTSSRCARFLLTLCALLTSIGGCEVDPKPGPPRWFDAGSFPGLVDGDVDRYEAAKLDYELDTRDGGTLHFRRCAEVAALDEGRVVASQYPLLRLLTLNCLALERYSGSREARRSHFPARLEEAFAAQLPATAVPHVSDEDMLRREGKGLADYEQTLEASLAADGSLRITTADDELSYVVMARADFDGDAAEDLLVRIDWHARDAFGQGSDLVLLTKPSEAAPVLVAWRP